MTDAAVVAALRAGDEAESPRLTLALTPALVAVARRYVDSPAAAEDLVQEARIAMLDGLDRSEQRTWVVIGILVHKARRLGARDRDRLPSSSVRRDERAPAVDPAHFDRTGHWAIPPARWDTGPDERLVAAELREVGTAITALPRRHRSDHLAGPRARDADGRAPPGRPPVRPPRRRRGQVSGASGPPRSPST